MILWVLLGIDHILHPRSSDLRVQAAPIEIGGQHRRKYGVPLLTPELLGVNIQIQRA